MLRTRNCLYCISIMHCIVCYGRQNTPIGNDKALNDVLLASNVGLGVTPVYVRCLLLFITRTWRDIVNMKIALHKTYLDRKRVSEKRKSSWGLYLVFKEEVDDKFFDWVQRWIPWRMRIVCFGNYNNAIFLL